MTKKTRWHNFRVKFDYLNSIKYYRKYIWGYSPLSEDSKTLKFFWINRVFCCNEIWVIPNRPKIRLFQIQTSIKFWFGRFEKPTKHCKQEGFSPNKTRLFPCNMVQYFWRNLWWHEPYPDIWAIARAQILAKSRKTTKICAT